MFEVGEMLPLKAFELDRLRVAAIRLYLLLRSQLSRLTPADQQPTITAWKHACKYCIIASRPQRAAPVFYAAFTAFIRLLKVLFDTDSHVGGRDSLEFTMLLYEFPSSSLPRQPKYRIVFKSPEPLSTVYIDLLDVLSFYLRQVNA